MHIDVIGWLHTLPPEVVYIAVFLIVGVESIGVPLPGEVTLVGAALLASQNIANPWIIWLVGAAGAIIGDSIGYFVGNTRGQWLLKVLGKWFPKHVNPKTTKLAEKAFHKYGAKTVFFGRFIAFLRIFAGPIAGILKMPYQKFLLANASGAIVWSGITVWGVYFFGVIAEKWLARLSWVALVVTIVLGTILSMVFTKRLEAYLEKEEETGEE
jgi:membrane protein DedA with SNARE-associated domain